MHFIGRNPADKAIVASLPAELDGQLLVMEGERALLMESGAILVDLEPGRHRLSPAKIPALRVAGDLAGVRIFLVRTEPIPLPLRGSTPPLAVDGYNVLARVELEGVCQIQVTDPRRLLASLSSSGTEVGTALGEVAAEAVGQALTQALRRSSAPLPALCAQPPPALLEEVRARAADRLATYGAMVTALELALRLDDEAKLQLAQTMPPGSSGVHPVAHAAITPAPATVPAPAATPAATAPAAATPAEAPATAVAVCPGCGAPGSGARFCSVCGGPFSTGCSACGAAVAAGARFCSVCGKPVSVGPPRCRGCGAQLAPNAKFCSGCGAKS